MFEKLLRFRYIMIIAVIIMLVSSLFFLIGGTVMSVKAYIHFIQMGLTPTGDYKAGLSIMNGLDAFMLSIIFMIFGLGIGRLFLFDRTPDEKVPSWLRFHDLKGLKVLIWEAILVTLVIFSLHDLLLPEGHALETLIFPGAILILTLSLFLMRRKE
ncbi:hypothetical protein EG830_01445 [bacterium]|nr:hypothetical protein [bacterium]